jgi:hypothetical protein
MRALFITSPGLGTFIRWHRSRGHSSRVTLPDLLSWCESWTPDLIVDDNYDFAGRIAGDRLDITYTTMKVVDAYPYAARCDLVPALGVHRTSLGLSSDSDGAMLFRYFYLVNEPESFQVERQELPPTTFRCRREVFDRSGEEQLPPWLHDLPSRPTVYATASTSVNRISSRMVPDVLR